MAASQSRRILVISGLTAVYFVAGRFGLSLAFVTTTVMLAVAAEVSRRRAAEAESRSLNDALEKLIAREQAARRDAEDANTTAALSLR